jgi:hypothetical protein
MESIFSARATAEAIPVWFVSSANYSDVQRSIGAEASAFAQAAGFEPKAGRYLLLPGKGGAGRALGGVLFGVEDADKDKDKDNSPMTRPIRGSPRWRLRSALIVSRATARPTRARSSSICRKASRARSWSTSSKA